MKLTVLTMITKPDERQDKWREALQNYLSFADEVVCVNGGSKLEFEGVKMIDREWPDDWKWQQLPDQLNFGKIHCTGDWILKLDIDMMLSPLDYYKLRKFLDNFDNENIDSVKLSKLNFVADMRYYSKSSHPILFRNKPDIGFGWVKDFIESDNCVPMRITGYDYIRGMFEGIMLGSVLAPVSYWNFSYTFKTKKVAKAHYGRMARAWKLFFNNNNIGQDEEEAWKNFKNDLKRKVKRATYKVELGQLPKEIRSAIKNLTPEQKGYNAWGQIII